MYMTRSISRSNAALLRSSTPARASVATITSLVGRGPLMLSPVVPFHRPGSALRFLDNGGPEPTPPCKHRWVTATLAQAGREGVAYKADVTEGAPQESDQVPAKRVEGKLGRANPQRAARVELEL